MKFCILLAQEFNYVLFYHKYQRNVHLKDLGYHKQFFSIIQCSESLTCIALDVSIGLLQ